MTLPSRKTLLGNLAALLALGWLYGGDLQDALRAREAEVAAYTQLPSIIAPACVLAVAAAGLAIVVWGLVRRRGDDFKGYRLLPIVLVVSLMVDLVRANSTHYLGSADLIAAALARLEEGATELSTPEAVPSDAEALRPLVEQLGPAPYLVRGQPVGAFALEVRQGCTGPVVEAPEARPGTLFYCVAGDRHTAWVTAMGLAQERRFGAPEIVSVGGVPYMVQVSPRRTEPLLPPEELPPGLTLPEAARGESALDAGVAGPAVLP